MADLFGPVYYTANTIPSLSKWNILKNATINNETITIEPGGYAGISIPSIFNLAFKASNYRRFVIGALLDIKDVMNYQNLVEFLMVVTYRNESGGVSVYRLGLNFTKENSAITDDSYLKMAREIQMGSFDFETCQVMIKNNSEGNVTITECSMFRSQDISSSQVGESIGWGVTLAKVVQYLDGCELYYDGIDTPDKLWWVSDLAGNFAGVNVNNEKTIKFSKKNEVLLD